MSKHLETLRSVMLFATVVLLIVVLYRRLLFVLGKRKSMTAQSDVTARLEKQSTGHAVAIQTTYKMQMHVAMHSDENPTGTVLFEGECEPGLLRIPLPALTGTKPFCKVQCGKEEFNLYC
jgi:hypothetical protein